VVKIERHRTEQLLGAMEERLAEATESLHAMLGLRSSGGSGGPDVATDVGFSDALSLAAEPVGFSAHGRASAEAQAERVRKITRRCAQLREDSAALHSRVDALDALQRAVEESKLPVELACFVLEPQRSYDQPGGPLWQRLQNGLSDVRVAVLLQLKNGCDSDSDSDSGSGSDEGKTNAEDELVALVQQKWRLRQAALAEAFGKTAEDDDNPTKQAHQHFLAAAKETLLREIGAVKHAVKQSVEQRVSEGVDSAGGGAGAGGGTVKAVVAQLLREQGQGLDHHHSGLGLSVAGAGAGAGAGAAGAKRKRSS
jgi:hypothetical protein